MPWKRKEAVCQDSLKPLADCSYLITQNLCRSSSYLSTNDYGAQNTKKKNSILQNLLSITHTAKSQMLQLQKLQLHTRNSHGLRELLRSTLQIYKQVITAPAPQSQAQNTLPGAVLVLGRCHKRNQGKQENMQGSWSFASAQQERCLRRSAGQELHSCEEMCHLVAISESGLRKNSTSTLPDARSVEE